MTSTSQSGPAAQESLGAEPNTPVARLAKHMAENVCQGFITHDRRDREACIAAFFEVDRNQFGHLTDDEAYVAARAYVDALWAKDHVEKPYVREDGSLEREPLDEADWGPVEECLRERAEVVGMDAEYASATTEGWRKHKTGGDYWTPHMIAQRHEVRAAIGDPEYPRKRGTSPTGVGPLPARYLVGIELHDMKSEAHWGEAVDVMAGYYADILRAQRGE